jgi:hypothetical protein
LLLRPREPGEKPEAASARIPGAALRSRLDKVWNPKGSFCFERRLKPEPEFELALGRVHDTRG